MLGEWPIFDLPPSSSRLRTISMIKIPNGVLCLKSEMKMLDLLCMVSMAINLRIHIYLFQENRAIYGNGAPWRFSCPCLMGAGYRQQRKQHRQHFSKPVSLRIPRASFWVPLYAQYSLPPSVEVITAFDGVEHIWYESIVCLLPVSNESLPQSCQQGAD